MSANTSACPSAANSPVLNKKSKPSRKVYTDFRIFEESLGIGATSYKYLDMKSQANLAKRVKPSGHGLTSGSTGIINKFRMNLPNVGFGYFDLRFCGPSRVILDHQQTKTGILEVFYKVNEPGDYSLSVLYLGLEVPGSDFKITIKKQECNPKAVVASGKGLKKVKAGERGVFNVDTRKAGSGKLVVTIQSPNEVATNEIKPYVDATKSGYTVEYYPVCSGEHLISVKYNDDHILGSPFKVKISTVSTLPSLVIGEYEKYFYSPVQSNDSNECNGECYGASTKKHWSKYFGLKLLKVPELRKAVM